MTMQFFNLIVLMTLLVAVEGFQWAVDTVTCDATQQGQIQRAIAEMTLIARNAVGCTRGLQDLTPSNCFPTVVLNTFQAYFRNGYNRGRGAVVLGFLDGIANVRNSNVRVILYCDDTMWTQIPGRGTTYFYTQNNIQYSTDRKPCINTPDDVTNGITFTDIGMIIICPRSFTAFRPTAGNRVNSDVRGQNLVITNDRTLSTVVLHEFLHLLFPGTMCCRGAEWEGTEGTKELISYLPCTRKALEANGGDITVRMPDCLALYAYSLYCRGNDWSLGIPMPLPG